MAFTRGSAQFTNGSTTVTNVSLTSGTLAYFASGTRVIVGANPVIAEVEAVSTPSVTSFELREPWAHTGGTYNFLANQTSEGLRDAVQAVRTSNTNLEGFINSIDVNPTNNSVAQRTANGRVKTANATESNDAVALGQAVTLTGNQTITGIKRLDDGVDAGTNLILRTGTTERMRIDSNGRFLINETSPAYFSKFTVSFDPAIDNGPIFVDSRSFAINRGGSMSFGGKFNSAGAYRPYGQIAARKENDTDGNSAAYLQFLTNANSDEPTERMRITSAGNVGIGTSLPVDRLDVASGVLRKGRTSQSNIAINATQTIFTGASDSVYLILVTRSQALSRMRFGIFIPGQTFVQLAASAIPQFSLSVSGNDLRYTQEITEALVEVTAIRIANT